MKNPARFAKGMLALSLSLKMYGRELSDPMQEVYWRALSDLSDDEFEQAATVLLRRETEFPPPAMFLEVVRVNDSNADAHRALMLAWNAGKQVIPGEGCWWSGALIREKVGPAAYEAFHACGGSSAFRDLDNEYHGPRIRREFMECYRTAVATDSTRALPEASTPLLTTGQILLEAEAVKVGTLDAVRAQFLAQQGAERAQLLETFTKPAPGPMTEEDRAALDRLGEKIAAKRRQLATPTGDTR